MIDSPVNTRIVAAEAITATTTPASIGATSHECDEVLVQCWSTSAASLFVGSPADQVIEITAGNSLTFAVTDPNGLWVKTASGTGSGGWVALKRD